MATSPQRSCPWDQVAPECNRSLNSPPRITSSLWKQLSEERSLSDIKLPTFMDWAEESEAVADTSFPLFTKPQDVWKAPSPEHEDMDQLSIRSPWDPLTSGRQRPCTVESYLGASSPNSATRSATSEEDLYGRGDQENVSPVPAPSEVLGHDRSTCAARHCPPTEEGLFRKRNCTEEDLYGRSDKEKVLRAPSKVVGHDRSTYAERQCDLYLKGDKENFFPAAPSKVAGHDKQTYSAFELYGNSDKENIFPAAPSKVVSHDRQPYSALLDKRESIPPSTTEFLPHQQQGVSSSMLWNASPMKLPFGSSSQSTHVSTSDSYASLGSAQPWEPVSSFRPVLRDIGNLCYPSVTSVHPKTNNALSYIPTPSDFSTPLSSGPFGTSAHDSCYSQEPTNYGFQSQKQHTDLVALMQELSFLTDGRDMGNNASCTTTHPGPCQKPPPPLQHQASLANKGCVFCKNNNYHSTFYKSHVLKDERGHCQCPVLRMYVCPLCNATGDSAHTLKYCPRNTVTRGDPIAAGLPPGKVTNWREVAHRMMTRYTSTN